MRYSPPNISLDRVVEEQEQLLSRMVQGSATYEYEWNKFMYLKELKKIKDSNKHDNI